MTSVCAGAVMVLLLLSSCARPHIEYDGTTHRGEATYYEDGLLGNCSFPPETRPVLHAAMNRVDYDGSRSCGAYVTVRRANDPRKREVTVLIDNQCPECRVGDIDLSPEAFDQIAERVEGRVPVEWNYVPAPAAGQLRYRWKEGSSRWWFQLLVMGHQHVLELVEVQAPGTGWMRLERKEHNYWEAPKGINGSVGPFTIRVTDLHGSSIIDRDIPLDAGQVLSGRRETDLSSRGP